MTMTEADHAEVVQTQSLEQATGAVVVVAAAAAPATY